MTRKSIAVSDVDGTIVKGSLVLGHAVSLHKENIIDLGELPEQWLNNQKDETLVENLATAYKDAILGKTVCELKTDKYISEVVENDENFYSVLKRLQKIKEDGGRVVLISGSPSFLIERFGAHYGFDCVGSDYEVDERGVFTGQVRGMFNSSAKRDYLNGLNLDDYTEVFAFGDTRSDFPLFEKAGYSVLVEPNDDTFRSIGHAVNEVLYF